MVSAARVLGLSLVACGVAVAQPTTSTRPDEPTLVEQIGEAQMLVESELATSDDEEPNALTLQAELLDGFAYVEPPESSWPVVVLPGGIARYTRLPGPREGAFAGFQLFLPKAAESEQAVLDGGQPIIEFVRLTVGPDAGDTLHLSSDRESPAGMLTVEVIQLSPTVFPDEPGVRFYVTGRLDDGTRVRERHEASSLAALRREHREAFDKFATPLFERLGLAEVLEAELRETAMDVLLTDLPIDGKTKAAVDEAIKGLDADAWPDRQRAADRLATLGPSAIAELARRLQTSNATRSAEAEGQMRRLVDSARVLHPAEAERLRSDRAFLRQVAELDDAKLRTAAESRLSTLR
ncbi:MAG: hypothetical protein AAGI46_02385 [Planctomycetota bacterium]